MASPDESLGYFVEFAQCLRLLETADPSILIDKGGWVIRLTTDADDPEDALALARNLVDASTAKTGFPRWPVVRLLVFNEAVNSRGHG